MGSIDGVNFIQVNLHRSKAATLLFSNNFGKYAIGFVQEPYTVKGEISGIKRGLYTVLHRPDKNEFPRAGLILNKDLVHLPLTQFISRDLVAALADFEMNGVSHKVVWLHLIIMRTLIQFPMILKNS